MKNVGIVALYLLKNVDHVKETMDRILECGCKIDFVQMSGGSFYDHDREGRLYLPYIRAIGEALDIYELKQKISVHLTSMPPRDSHILKEMEGVRFKHSQLRYRMHDKTRKMFELRNIYKSFGDVQVLNGIYFRLERGTVYTLKGGNDAGKSTVLKTIYGWLESWTPEEKIF